MSGYGPKPRQGGQSTKPGSSGSSYRKQDEPEKRGQNYFLIGGLFVILMLVIGGGGLVWLNLPPSSVTPAPVVLPESEALTIPDIIEAVRPAVVQVIAFDNLLPPSQGSGVVIKPEGYVLTNAHVVREYETIQISLLGGSDEVIDADLVGIAPCRDLALLRLSESTTAYPYIELRDTFDIRAGDEVLAMGYPLNARIGATDPSATVDRISRLDLTLNNVSSLIEHQAAINPGNSGGPLLDISGQLVGINSMSITDTQGLFYAIDLPTVNTTVDYLYRQVAPTDLTVISSGDAVTGFIHSVNEVLCWTFDAEAGQQIRLTAEGDLDTQLFLYSPDNQYLVENDDRSSGNTDSLILYDVSVGGRYQVVLRSHNSDESGEFVLRLGIR